MIKKAFRVDNQQQDSLIAIDYQFLLFAAQMVAVVLPPLSNHLSNFFHTLSNFHYDGEYDHSSCIASLLN